MYNIALRYGHFNGIPCFERITDSVFALFFDIEMMMLVSVFVIGSVNKVDRRTISRLFKFHAIFSSWLACVYSKNIRVMYAMDVCQLEIALVHSIDVRINHINI